MSWFKAMLLIAATINVCMAQSITITGTVKDASSNAAIKGAIVRLLHTVVKPDTTDDLGAFSLVGTIARVNGHQLPVSSQAVPITMANGEIVISLIEKQHVQITTYSLNGNLIHSMAGLYGPGIHAILPHQSVSGVCLTRIAIGKNAYCIRQALAGDRSGYMQNAGIQPHGPQELAKQMAFPDTLLITCSGYASRQIAVSNPVTTGLSITLTQQTSPPGMKLISAKNKSFQMGQAGGTDLSVPVHTVTFDHDYWMDSTEVTQENYLSIMGSVTANIDRPHHRVQCGSTWKLRDSER
jgi:hypothetical protein